MFTPYLTLIFAFLGFFLLGGRASQANSLYLFGVILPWLLFHKKIRAINYPLLTLGIAFSIMHWFFPLHNLIIAWTQGYSLVGIIKSEFLKSEFSSCIGLTGLFMFLFWLAERYHKQSPHPSTGQQPPGLTPFEAMTAGMLVSSIILTIYGFYQCATGFDFYQIVGADRVLPNGFYRIAGFSIHPIPFSGMTLTIFCIYLNTLLTHNFRLGWTKIAAYVITVTHLLLTFLSGSRITAIIAVLVLMYSLVTKIKFGAKLKAIILTIVTTLVAFAVIWSGLIYRFQETLGDSAVAGFGERATFWKVHLSILAQNPLFGTGKYWLETMLRNNYYNMFGYQDFVHKYNAHNIYLELLAQIGIGGFAIISMCCIFVVRALTKAAKTSPAPALYGSLGLAFSAQLIFGLTQNTFGDAPVDLVLMSFIWTLFWNDVYLSAGNLPGGSSVQQ